MKTIKPLRLMVMPRPYRWRNGKYLAVTVAALVSHDGDQPKILPEYTLMHDVLPGLDCDEIFDYVMPKTNPEYLVSGYAYTAHQQDKTKCMVRVTVADKSKEGVVFGDRYWDGDTITKPRPFEHLELSWKNSFGGADFPDNPLGTGLDLVDIDGTRAIKLPNLESPTERIHSRQQRVRPFNFGQIRIDWPHRLQKMGSCDQEWVDKVGIGFFDDMQPDVFNAAADEQIWKNKEALSMDEPFEIWNMHPDLQCWSGKLPPLRARCFIKRRQDTDLAEVALRPTTVWFIPHRTSYLVLFHGSVAIQEDDAFDVAAIMAAMEVHGQPRTLEHYTQVFEVRSDVKQASLHVFKDDELMPADMLAPWMESMPLDQHSMLSKISRMGGERQGFPNGDFVGPIKPLTLADMPIMIERNEKHLAEAMEEHERNRQSALAEVANATSAPSPEQQALADIYRNLDFNNGSTEIRRLPISGPPDTQPLQEMVKSSRQRESMRSILRESDRGPDMGSLHEAAAFTRRSLNKLYLYSVHYQQGVVRVGEHRAMELRKRIMQKYRLGKNLSKMNLTGADLSGMDLSGADFSEAWLENVDFSGANLSGAKFKQTVLARATFLRANLDGADLVESNISEAVFDQTSFCRAHLQMLICEAKTTFRNCRFEDATIERLGFERSEFVQSVFRRTKLHSVSFRNCVMSECEFDDCGLVKTDVNDSSMNSVVMRDTSITNGTYMNTEFNGVEITGSKFGKTTFFEDVAFHDSTLTGNYFRQTMFREVPFSNVDFSESTFEQCDFSLANLQRCRLRNIRAPQSMFARTNLDMADLSGSNLMYCSFQKSSFIGANLSNCNFFRADMSETILDDSTRTDSAYVHRTRLAPFYDGVNRMSGYSS